MCVDASVNTHTQSTRSRIHAVFCLEGGNELDAAPPPPAVTGRTSEGEQRGTPPQMTHTHKHKTHKHAHARAHPPPVLWGVNTRDLFHLCASACVRLPESEVRKVILIVLVSRPRLLIGKLMFLYECSGQNCERLHLTPPQKHSPGSTSFIFYVTSPCRTSAFRLSLVAPFAKNKPICRKNPFKLRRILL